ncbi:uncharacterized protein EV422DRAFT_621404 [Fimicolochytrium jonesii]|uniref:uncharacterized protein n=1 Tax=Fimicolochytrium jonesii TaxID=1396493 RepID=UPI0022FF38D5|nr:uncharacterized protein EV422DRAFT_621404 [Fimicolochytrium jonesii]KAI8818906.1 hypothetical protein EV422DRAFT_621404 [Fimicolochytrium jonesii]
MPMPPNNLFSPTAPTGSDIVLADVVRPMAEACMTVLNKLVENGRSGGTSRICDEQTGMESPTTKEVVMALEACRFLLELPLKTDGSPKDEMDQDQVEWMEWMGQDSTIESLNAQTQALLYNLPPPTAAPYLGTDIMALILNYVGDTFTLDPTLRLSGQLDLLKTCQVNKRWYKDARCVLWRDPVFASVSSVLKFGLGVRWSAALVGTHDKTNDTDDDAATGDDSLLTIGDAVRRLALPVFPRWTVGGAPMVSGVVMGIAGKCSNLRTLKFENEGDAVDVPGLCAIFRACPHLDALRLSIELDEEDSDDEHYEDDEDNLDMDEEDGYEMYADRPFNDEASCHSIIDGMARLRILDIARIRTSHRKNLTAFLALVRKGLASNLQQLYVSALYSTKDASCRLSDVRILLQRIATEAPALEILHVLLPLATAPTDGPIPHLIHQHNYQQLHKNHHQHSHHHHHSRYKSNNHRDQVASLCSALHAVRIGCPVLRMFTFRHRVKQYRPDAFAQIDDPLTFKQIESAICTMFTGLRCLTHLDIQGLEATERIVTSIIHHAPRCLTALFMDIDACPPPALVSLITYRGGTLTSLSMLSVLTFPPHHVLDEISIRCRGSLRYLDLRHKPPDPTEHNGQVHFTFPEQWLASLRNMLTACTRLEKTMLSWVPSGEYEDAGLTLYGEFGNQVCWERFPAEVGEAGGLEYPVW